MHFFTFMPDETNLQCIYCVYTYFSRSQQHEAVKELITKGKGARSIFSVTTLRT